MREYLYVRAAEIDIQNLDRAGYQIIHIPAFAMYGHTRTAWQLDPERRTAIDAAPASLKYRLLPDSSGYFC